EGDGSFAGAYDFGWDITPAVWRHGGDYSLIIKDNHYSAGPFYVTQLSSAMRVEWQFRSTNTESCERSVEGEVVCEHEPEHANGFEWCINAAAVDAQGNVHVTSEDGNYYAIGQGGVELGRFFLDRALEAAYTPVAIDAAGRVYAMNAGKLYVLGQ